MSKIILFGATGNIGQRILAEALQHGHEVTAFVRDPAKLKDAVKPTGIAQGDVTNPAEAARAIDGHEVVISALGPRSENPREIVDLYQSLTTGMRQAGVRRLIVVGGAGQLEVAPGIRLSDTPEFPKEFLGVAKAHGDLFELLQGTDLNWTYISPAAFIHPGERTGKYRRGADQLLVDSKGNSEISMEDYAVGLLDEVEKPEAVRRRITFAW
jgi:putative NADH-flavin reductase